MASPSYMTRVALEFHKSYLEFCEANRRREENVLEMIDEVLTRLMEDGEPRKEDG